MSTEDEVIADMDARGVKPGNAKPWQDAIAGKAGRSAANLEVMNFDFASIERKVAERSSDAHSCSYQPKRATEQECARELWHVRAGYIAGKLEIIGREPFIACTLHLPVLMSDQFVSEYQLVRLNERAGR